MNAPYIEVKDLPDTRIKTTLLKGASIRVKFLGSGVLGLDTYSFYETHDGSHFYIAISEMVADEDRQMFERIAQKAGVDT